MIDIQFRFDKNGVPILSKKDIDYIAEQILADYNPSLLKNPTPTPIEELIEFYLDLDMDYADLSPDSSILGMTAFEEGYVEVYDAERRRKKNLKVRKGTILIDNSLLASEEKRRCRFTCSHESSHWICHRHKYTKVKGQLSLFPENEKKVIKCLSRNIENIAISSTLRTDADWVEWQADYMASALLMPKGTFRIAVREFLKSMGIKEDYLTVDQDPFIDSYALSLAKDIAEIFDVSRKAALIRLIKLEYIREKQTQLVMCQNC